MIVQSFNMTDRVSVIDVCNADDGIDTVEEELVRNSVERKAMFSSKVPNTRKNYHQKETPDNPIEYLRNLNETSIFRFIITHPDMDHLDGIKDLFETFKPINTWDTNNNKQMNLADFCAKYNRDDWRFYKNLRDGNNTETKRLTYYSDTIPCKFWGDDYLRVLSPSPSLIKSSNENGDYNDISYVLLFTPPKKNGKHWKIVFGGDSHDNAWEHILHTYEESVSDIDILFAPHHGRDSKRNWSFLKTLTPTLTLFGNASSEYLAYDNYPLHITNNQAGYIILDISPDAIKVYVKNKEFANDFCEDHKLKGLPLYNRSKQAYLIGSINA